MVLHRKIGIHPLELGVFGFEFPDALELGDAQATVSALPVVVGRLAYAVLAAYFGDLQASIGFLEDRHDLALGESAFLHWFGSVIPTRSHSFQIVPCEGKLTLAPASN